MLLLVSKYFEIMILVETKPHDSKIIIELDIQIYKVGTPPTLQVYTKKIF